jgi:ABC-type multidrug transport system permease subunit
MPEQPNDLSSSRKDRSKFWIASIISNLVVAILFAIFFQNIATSISQFIANLIGSFYRGYIDGLYDQAAQSPTDFLLYFLFTIVVLMPAMVTAMIAITSVISSKLLSSVEIKRISRQGTYIIALYLAAPLSFAILLLFISGPLVSITANAKFQRRLMALSPAISQQEKNEILGKWAMMKSQADYEKIMDDIKSIAENHGLKLPNIKNH